jgi:hypothetical protein
LRVQERPDDFERLSPVDDRPAAARRSRATVRGGRVEADRALLEPRGVGAIVDLGLDVLRERFALFVGLASLLWVPVRALQPFLGPQVWMETIEREGLSSTDTIFGYVLSLLVTAVLAGMVHAIGSALIAVQIEAMLHGREQPVGEAVRRVLFRAPKLLLLSFFVAVAKTIGAVTCAGFFVAIWLFSLAPIVFIVEGHGIRQSLRRSITLASGSFLRFIGVWFVGVLLSAFFELSTGIADDANVRETLIGVLAISPAVFDVGLVVLTSLFLGVSTAILAAVLTALYFDLLVRRDGIDLRQTLDRVRGVSEPAPLGGGATA